jgi:hypothetical protein
MWLPADLGPQNEFEAENHAGGSAAIEGSQLICKPHRIRFWLNNEFLAKTRSVVNQKEAWSPHWTIFATFF